MSMIDDAADNTKDAVKRTRKDDEPRDERTDEQQPPEEDARDTSGEVPVDNLE